MKKLIYIFSIISSILVFQILFSTCSQNQYIQIGNFANAAGTEKNQYIIGREYTLGKTEKEKKESFADLEDFIITNHVTAIIPVSKTGDNLKQINYEYIYTQDDLSDYSFFKTNNYK